MSTNKLHNKIKPIKNRYSKARGGTSHFYNICCAKCGDLILLYQKDGPGALIRLYLDRIFEPKDKAQLQFITEYKKIPNLVCPKCGALIGTPMIYEPENRWAIRLQRGAFSKK